MTQQARNRRLGWIATLSVCLVLYIMLHLKVTAMHSAVLAAEGEIVRLEQRNMLLETEVQTRSSQIKLAEWNRVEFGYHAPQAEQYIAGERGLARLGSPRAQNAPAPIRLATITTGEGAPPFPTLNRQREVAAPNPALNPAGRPADSANGRRAAPSDRVRVEISGPTELAVR